MIAMQPFSYNPIAKGFTLSINAPYTPLAFYVEAPVRGSMLVSITFGSLKQKDLRIIASKILLRDFRIAAGMTLEDIEAQAKAGPIPTTRLIEFGGQLPPKTPVTFALSGQFRRVGILGDYAL